MQDSGAVMNNDQGAYLASGELPTSQLLRVLSSGLPSLYRRAYRLLGNEADAEDVLQETFLKAYRNIGRFKGESQFYTWLVRIAMNEGLTKLRRRRASNWISLDEPENSEDSTSEPHDIEDWRDNPEESYGRAELRTILSHALQGLEAPLRLVFVLRHIADLSSRDTARVLGLTDAAVRSRLLRARLKLRKRLNFWFGDRCAFATW